MIRIHITKKDIHLDPDELSLAAGSSARNVLRDEFLRRIEAKTGRYNPITTLMVNESTLKRMISKYSEQVIYQPLNEIRFWFTYTSGAYIEPGYPPLFYFRKGRNFSPNKTAVAGIGEGVAGLISQRLIRCRKLSRPNHDYPDIVMDSNGKTYLVESKATLESRDAIKTTIKNEIPTMAGLLSSSTGLDVRPNVSLLIGTFIEKENEYECYITELKT
jgi:hypothetical protein